MFLATRGPFAVFFRRKVASSKELEVVVLLSFNLGLRSGFFGTILGLLLALTSSLLLVLLALICRGGGVGT
jgi:hypothetical protein